MKSACASSCSRLLGSRSINSGGEQMEVVLEALLECVTDIDLGEPILGTNRGLYGFKGLPDRPISASGFLSVPIWRCRPGC
jgi:hypothetical protein